MADENYDWKTATAFEEYLKLKRENREMEVKIGSNKEKMNLLLKDFPPIGNMKGMLRKDKEIKKKKETPKSPPRSPLPPNPTPTKVKTTGLKRKAPDQSGIEGSLTRLENEKKKKTTAQVGRSKAVDQGGDPFHSTSHSSPPPFNSTFQ